jgi:hypothetical protein
MTTSAAEVQGRVVRVMLETKVPYLKGRLRVRHDSRVSYLFRVTKLASGANVVTSVDFTREDLDRILARMASAATEMARGDTNADSIVGHEERGSTNGTAHA